MVILLKLWTKDNKEQNSMFGIRVPEFYHCTGVQIFLRDNGKFILGGQVALVVPLSLAVCWWYLWWRTNRQNWHWQIHPWCSDHWSTVVGLHYVFWSRTTSTVEPNSDPHRNVCYRLVSFWLPAVLIHRHHKPWNQTFSNCMALAQLGHHSHTARLKRNTI